MTTAATNGHDTDTEITEYDRALAVAREATIAATTAANDEIASINARIEALTERKRLILVQLGQTQDVASTIVDAAEIVAKHGPATVGKLAKAAGIDTASLTKALRTAVSNGTVVKSGAARGTTYGVA